MFTKFSLWTLLLLALSAVFFSACSSNQPEVDTEFRTWLLVKAPEQPLPVNRQIKVISRTKDMVNGVSHIELYAVETPAGDGGLMIRSDAAPFEQKIFTAEQPFIPKQPGDYIIKVVGYNKLGDPTESASIKFTAQ